MTAAPPVWTPRAARQSGGRMLPLSSNVQGYSQADVEYRMRSGAAQFQPRFELYDGRRNRVLPDVTTVYEAEVEWDESREVPRSLHVKLLADDRLRYRPYQWMIRPYFGVGPMADGGFAEFSMGMYPWTRPKRDVFGVTGEAEGWEATLGDQTHFLSVDGPLEVPMEIFIGLPIIEHVKWVLWLNGYDVYGGGEGRSIDHSPALSAVYAWYGYYASGSTNPFTNEWKTGEPQTWLNILKTFHGAMGYNNPYFDNNGLYAAKKDRAWSIEGPDVVYDTADDGVVLAPVSEEPDMDKIANRVVGFKPQPDLTDWWWSSYADLDWYLPQHPLAHLNTGHYITRKVDNIMMAFASSDWAIYELCVSDLFTRLAYFEKVTLERVGFLGVHDGYHIVGVNVENDPQISTRGAQFGEFGHTGIPLYRETAHKTDLFTGKATSTLGKLFREANAPPS